MSLLLSIQVRLGPGRVLTDADVVPVLSNSAGTIGVFRADTGASVVTAGTPMTRSSTGVYVYELTPVIAGVVYSYWTRVTVNTQVVHHRKEATATPVSMLPSYLGVIEADALAASLLPLPRYAAATPEKKQQALVSATLRVDASNRWQGRRYDADQALEFPRVPYDDRVWDPVPGVYGAAAVPPNVKLATLYEANAMLDAHRQARLQQIADGLTAQSTGSLSESYARVGPHTPAGRPVLIADAAALLDKYRLRTGGLL